MKIYLQYGERLFVLICVAVALFLRSPELVCSPSFWAEDGVIFFKDAYVNGFASVFHPYAGYFHVLTRLSAYVSVCLFPLEAAPALFMAFFVIAVFFVAYEYLSAQCLSPFAGAVGALAIVMVPHCGEVFFSLTNAHWILAALYPLLIIERPFDNKMRLLNRCVLLLLLGLNDPHVMVSFPFFCLRIFRLRKIKSEWMFFSIALLCCLIQAAALIMSHTSGPDVVSNLTLDETVKYWVLGLLVQPVAMFFLGSEVARMAFSSLSIGLIGACWILCMLCSCIVLWRKSSSDAKRLSILYLIFSVFFFFASIYRFTKCPDFIVKCGASRYFFLPYVFAAVSIAICVGDKVAFPLRFVFGGLLFSSIAIGSISGYRVPDRVPLSWGRHMSELREKGKTVVPVSPGDDWTIVLESAQ